MDSHKKKLNTITVDTSVNPDFLEDTLTQDISTLESLFDMIDNSIDAARNNILKDKFETDSYGLPSNYTGYVIKIRIDNDSIRIADNCNGISKKTLEKSTFHTGQTSSHSFGIGYYGIGLKRALLKAGTQYAMLTDDGETTYKSTFNNKSFGGNTESELTADGYQSQGNIRTLFSVSKLRPAIKYDISNEQWFNNAVHQFSIRYAIYINKGLQIKIKNVPLGLAETIISRVPTLRSNALVSPTFKQFNNGDVEVFIESGIHNEYVFPGETNHNIAVNRKLTDEFGLYFVCNDRVIVASSTEKQHGWNAKWHSEYNGYVCWVKFVSKGAGYLPWNTAKTALKTDSTIFLKVKEKLTPIANQYRSDIKARYTNKKRITKPQSTKSNINNSESKQNSITDSAQNITSTTSVASTQNSTSGQKSLNATSRPDTKINTSKAVIDKLIELDSKKLASLYSSLCRISLIEHPALMYVGAWSFFESLSSFSGKVANTDFPSFLNPKINAWYPDKSLKSAYKLALEHISKEGNSAKHHGTYYPTDAKQLANNFETLEPVIIKILADAISSK